MPVENGKVCNYTEKLFYVFIYLYIFRIKKKKQNHVTSDDFSISITWRGERNNRVTS